MRSVLTQQVAVSPFLSICCFTGVFEPGRRFFSPAVTSCHRRLWALLCTSPLSSFPSFKSRGEGRMWVRETALPPPSFSSKPGVLQGPWSPQAGRLSVTFCCVASLPRGSEHHWFGLGVGGIENKEKTPLKMKK